MTVLTFPRTRRALLSGLAALFLLPAAPSAARPEPAGRPSFPMVVRQLEQTYGAKFIGVQDDDMDVLRLRFIREDGDVFNINVDPATLVPIGRPAPQGRRKNY